MYICVYIECLHIHIYTHSMCMYLHYCSDLSTYLLFFNDTYLLILIHSFIYYLIYLSHYLLMANLLSYCSDY